VLGTFDGAALAPTIVGSCEGASEGIALGLPVTVGLAVIVGLLVGTVEGDSDAVGVKLGGSERTVVGSSDGISLGEGVANLAQAPALLPTQRGVNESNCWTVSNTAAKSHKVPLLFVKKLSLDDSELPKTTTSDAPTALFSKQVF
jgi:hypothetical protein